MQIVLSGEIADRYLDFVKFCHAHNKTPDERISELMLGDLLMHERLFD